jgi:hypothetical protein
MIIQSPDEPLRIRIVYLPLQKRAALGPRGRPCGLWRQHPGLRHLLIGLLRAVRSDGEDVVRPSSHARRLVFLNVAPRTDGAKRASRQARQPRLQATKERHADCFGVIHTTGSKPSSSPGALRPCGRTRMRRYLNPYFVAAWQGRDHKTAPQGGQRGRRVARDRPFCANVHRRESVGAPAQPRANSCW